MPRRARPPTRARPVGVGGEAGPPWAPSRGSGAGGGRPGGRGAPSASDEVADREGEPSAVSSHWGTRCFSDGGPAGQARAGPGAPETRRFRPGSTRPLPPPHWRPRNGVPESGAQQPSCAAAGGASSSGAPGVVLARCGAPAGPGVAGPAASALRGKAVWGRSPVLAGPSAPPVCSLQVRRDAFLSVLKTFSLTDAVPS